MNQIHGLSQQGRRILWSWAQQAADLFLPSGLQKWRSARALMAKFSQQDLVLWSALQKQQQRLQSRSYRYNTCQRAAYRTSYRLVSTNSTFPPAFQIAALFFCMVWEDIPRPGNSEKPGQGTSEWYGIAVKEEGRNSQHESLFLQRICSDWWVVGCVGRACSPAQYKLIRISKCLTLQDVTSFAKPAILRR